MSNMHIDASIKRLAGLTGPAGAGPLLEVDNLHVAFGQNGPEVIRGISFVLQRGECLALIGESGSGKSVTSRALVGLAGHNARVAADRLHFSGKDMAGFRERDWRHIRGDRIGFVMQDALGSLDPLQLIGRGVGEALRLHRDSSRAERDAKVIALLRSVGIPEPELRASQYPFQLSGGLRQRALIASAIACAPELLIADEPTTALDATVQAQVLDLLASLRSSNTSMLIVSHDFGVVARLADRVAVMLHGEIVEQGPVESILQDPQHAYTKSLLLAATAVRGRGHGGSQHAVTPVVSTTTVAPADASAAFASAALLRIGEIANAPFIVSASNLGKSFVGPDGVLRAAVANVSLGLRPGETLGIVGESGSGKTTLTRLLLGLEQPDQGSVQLRGRIWNALDAAGQRDERKRIQVVFQDPLASFDPRYTVERVIGEALAAVGVPRAARHARTLELLQLVRLDATYMTRRPIEMSGGQRQRVAIARALAPQPDVLVCDEPVSALDVSVQAQILDLLCDLKQRLGLSCLFISHDLGVIRRVSDRVMVMKDGVVVESGDVESVFEQPQHAYTRALLGALPAFEEKTFGINSIAFVKGNRGNEQERLYDAA
jgi:peptide/nickel transport system ATP-binding protein